MNKYFISFCGIDMYGETFFADTEISIESNIRSSDDILEIKEAIKNNEKCFGVEEIVITNIIKLPI